MSAHVVHKEDIDVLVAAAVTPRHLWYRKVSWFARDPHGGDWDYERDIREATRETADEVGRMLWSENVASVAHRYPDDTAETRPGPRDFHDVHAVTYTFTDPGFKPTPGEVFKTLDHYEYQSCEHPGWPTSEGKRFCDALRVATSKRVEGYEKAPWGWTPSDVAARRHGKADASAERRKATARASVRSLRR
jgi:hypothetical protein